MANEGISISEIQVVTGRKRPDNVQRYIKQIDFYKNTNYRLLCLKICRLFKSERSSSNINMTKTEQPMDVFLIIVYSLIAPLTLLVIAIVD